MSDKSSLSPVWEGLSGGPVGDPSGVANSARSWRSPSGGAVALDFTFAPGAAVAASFLVEVVGSWVRRDSAACSAWLGNHAELLGQTPWKWTEQL